MSNLNSTHPCPILTLMLLYCIDIRPESSITYTPTLHLPPNNGPHSHSPLSLFSYYNSLSHILVLFDHSECHTFFLHKPFRYMKIMHHHKSFKLLKTTHWKKKASHLSKISDSYPSKSNDEMLPLHFGFYP